MLPISSEAPCAKWMLGLVSITSDTVSKTEESPANASLQKSLHKPDFLKIEEAQGHFVVYWFMLALPKDRLPLFFGLIGSYLPQPITNSSRRHLAEARSLWEGVNPFPERRRLRSFT